MEDKKAWLRILSGVRFADRAGVWSGRRGPFHPGSSGSRGPALAVPKAMAEEDPAWKEEPESSQEDHD